MITKINFNDKTTFKQQKQYSKQIKKIYDAWTEGQHFIEIDFNPSTKEFTTRKIKKPPENEVINNLLDLYSDLNKNFQRQKNRK